MSATCEYASRSASPSSPVRPARTNPGDFALGNLRYYVTDNEADIAGRDPPNSPTPKPAKAAHRTSKKGDGTAKSANKSSKGKTPVMPDPNTQPQPVRRSPRNNAGTKRKTMDSSSDLEDKSSSPLAKKPKTSDVEPASPSPAKAKLRASSATLVKKAPSAPKPKLKINVSPKPKSKMAAPKPVAGPSKKLASTPDDEDDDEVLESDSDRPSRAKKAKKSNTGNASEALKEFELTAKNDGNGSSTQRPDFATLDTPWKCANRLCNTGMTWCNRGDGSEKSNGYGRKACSHWFGRNKKETGYIHEDVWHYFCRKCYQRQAYQARKPQEDPNINGLVKQHVIDLRNQIIRLGEWRPMIAFKIQLNKGARDRVAEYIKVERKSSAAEATEAVKFVPSKTKKGKDKKPRPEDEFPIDAILDFEENHAGDDKCCGDLVRVCNWIDRLNEAGKSPCDPPIEFLPTPMADDEYYYDPTASPDNYDRWCQYVDSDLYLYTPQWVRDEEEAAKNATYDEDDEGEHAVESDENGDFNNDADGNSDSGSNEEGDAAPSQQEDQEDVDECADDESISDSEEAANDAADSYSPPAPFPNGSFLRTTALGRRLGLKGKVGIFKGSGLVKDREREAAERETAEREAAERELELQRERAAADAINETIEASPEAADADAEVDVGVAVKPEVADDETDPIIKAES